MVKVAPGAKTVKGIDVSHYDGLIDFEQVKKSGREFIIAKCTEYNADNTYSLNKFGAKNAGLLFGAYHFFHPNKDPKAQAEKFLKIADLQKGELHPMLDWEVTDNVPSAEDVRRAKVWLDIVESACGKAPIIYGGPYFLNALNLDHTFRHYPLFVAHYGTSSPLVPAPWGVWSFWQHTDKGSVPGIPAPDEDLDVFNGSLEQLKKLTL